MKLHEITVKGKSIDTSDDLSRLVTWRPDRPAPRIPTQAEYEANETRLLLKQLADVERAPLSERKEAQESMRRAMADTPDIVGERVGWILNGSYGGGACRRAVGILAQSKRANKAAQLVQLVGALEWQSPATGTAAAWNTLTAKQKRALDKAVREAMKTEPAVAG